MTCGNCPPCLEQTNARLRGPAIKRTRARPAPTAAALEKHAKRFGSFMVNETAAEYGVNVTVAPPPKKKRWRR